MIFRETIDVAGMSDIQGGLVRLDLARQKDERSDNDLEVRVAAILQHVNLVIPRLPTIESYTRRYDATEARPDFKVVVTEAELSGARLSAPEEAAILLAINRVKRFHAAQLLRLTKGFRHTPSGWEWHMTARDGGEGKTGAIGQRMEPVARAGIYVPGGLATYPSSLIMNAIPALTAGVKEVIVATPPRPDGTIAPAVLFAARSLGITKILKAGGAYGIGGLAFGAIDNARADVIAGPGNRYVNEAKRQLWGKVGLDGYAGPSEVMVVTDGTIDPRYAAADLLTQIEHAPDNFACLLVRSNLQLNELMRELENQLLGSPREAVMREALAKYGVAIIVDQMDAACEFVNHVAPEHVSLLVKTPAPYLSQIRNAGCVLVGPYTAQSAGDFIVGPSHTLPTNGAARFGGPTNVMTFMKFSSLARLTEADLAEFTPAIKEFGAIEGFPAHARSATIRFN